MKTRILAVIVAATTFAGALVSAAAPASAADCVPTPTEQCVSDGTVSGEPTKPGDTPSTGGGPVVATGLAPETVISGGVLSFWEKGAVNISDFGAGGTQSLDYAGLYAAAGCSAGLGYINAKSGASYTITAGLWVKKSRTMTRYQGYENAVVIDEIRGGEWVYSTTKICETYTVPSPTRRELAQIGDIQTYGPFGSDSLPMRSVAAGGTNTRLIGGTIGTIGDIATGRSVLGDAVFGRVGKNEIVKATHATPAEAWKYGLLLDRLDVFKNLKDDFSAHGRWYSITHTWRSVVDAIVFESHSGDLNEMFPAWTSQAMVNYFPASGNRYPYYITAVSGPVMRPAINRFKIVCSSAGKAFDFVEVSGVDDISQPFAANWGDSYEGAYSYECGSPTPTPTDGSRQTVRTGDILRCDAYPQTTRQPFTYTTVVINDPRYFVKTGGSSTSYSPYPNGGSWYAAGNPNWNFGPEGFYRVDDNGYWVEAGSHTEQRRDPAPAGFTSDGTGWVSVNGDTILVDGKSAAPLTAGTSERLDAAGIYQANPFSDFYHLAWDLPKVQVNTGADKGVDVNDLGAAADVRWERMWALSSDSSPVLIDDGNGRAPTGTVNNSRQTYAITTDNTADTDRDAPSKAAKWLPNFDDGVGSAALNRWVGFDAAEPNTQGWERSQHAAWVRFWQSSTAGSPGWNLTGWVRTTATITLTTEIVSGVNVDENGKSTPVYSTITKPYRSTMACPMEPVRFNVRRVVN